MAEDKKNTVHSWPLDELGNGWGNWAVVTVEAGGWPDPWAAETLLLWLLCEWWYLPWRVEPSEAWGCLPCWWKAWCWSETDSSCEPVCHLSSSLGEDVPHSWVGEIYCYLYLLKNHIWHSVWSEIDSGNYFSSNCNIKCTNKRKHYSDFRLQCKMYLVYFMEADMSVS